jgi:hypothetical protein
MMAELDAKAAEQGIKWGPGEEAKISAERTRYATPGQACGRGRVRLLSAKQVAFIKRLVAERDTTKLTRLPGSEDIEFMSLRGASDLIERLLACPELPAEKIASSAPKASEKQVSFALSISARKLAVTEGSEEYAEAKKTFEAMTKSLISKKIDELLKLSDAPRKAEVPQAKLPEVPAGRYAIEMGGTLKFYQVDRPTKGRWNGYVFLKVQASDDTYPIKNPATKAAILAEIAKDSYAALLRYGQEIGSCGHCGRTLTDEDSRARGIGPICAAKF